jgi:predicted RNase H-like HicB family nuclease
MSEANEIELIFEPLEAGGFHVHAPDLPGLHTGGTTSTMRPVMPRRRWALYVEGLREDGGSLDTGVIRRVWLKKPGRRHALVVPLHRSGRERLPASCGTRQ